MGDAPEFIAQAAIVHEGTIYSVPRPGRHHNVFAHMRDRGIEQSDGEQGFLTNSRRFVDREEACRIAIAAGQIIEKTGPADILFSEDVW